MPQFIIRIELHQAKGEDYRKLHSAMGHHGFLRTITGQDGIVYLLPTAEYLRFGPRLTAEKFREDAIAIGLVTRHIWAHFDRQANSAIELA
jgi:hypothetical protein